MLEIDYDERSSYEYQFMTGKNLGFVQARLEWARDVLKKECLYAQFISDNPSAKVPEELVSFHKECIDFCIINGERTWDLFDFILRYRTLNNKLLTERVFRESEFWHGDIF